MSFQRNIKAIKTVVLLFSIAASNSLTAQEKPCKNQYPCGECAVHDNNGNDLAGFIRNYTKQLDNSGGKVISHSNNEWGYLLVRTANVPSVSSKWQTKGNLNYGSSIRCTFVLNKGEDNSVATWWGRECNMDNGPMVQVPTTDGVAEVELNHQSYNKVFSSLGGKKITLVEYLDTFNMRDYNYLLKNHLVAKCGVIKDEDYNGIVDYFNVFLSKFSYTNDPLLTKMSFVTFYTGPSNTRYVGYFNVVNDKLSGKLEELKLEYNSDRDSAVVRAFRNTSTKIVYIYGDDSYGLDKTIIKYAKDNDYILRRRETSVSTKFNNER